MRIDKYLWSIRVFKTRSIASDACKKNKISIKDINVKSSREVKVGDEIRIKKNQIAYLLKVIATPKNRVGAKLVMDYVKDITPPEEMERLELIKNSKNYYRQKGTGRPTKRDRRDLDTYFEKSEFDDEIEDIIDKEE